VPHGGDMTPATANLYGIVDSFAQAQLRAAPKYRLADCGMCRGTGRTVTTTVSGAEWEEQCRYCNGKCSIVTEIQS
jgi:DnaJ-class molecular chaperone